jgi:CubicO group peptidase (beta-lactamase class C family)
MWGTGKQPGACPEDGVGCWRRHADERRDRGSGSRPGTRSVYSNLSTLTLGQAIANAAGASYADLVSGEILQPLRMRMTGFAYTPDMLARAATGYHPRRSPMHLLLPVWVIGARTGRWLSFRRFLLDGAAYGGLLGPVRDAARFLQMHLRDGELDGARILPAQSAAAMRHIIVTGKRYDLGLGGSARPVSAMPTHRSWSTSAAAPGSST